MTATNICSNFGGFRLSPPINIMMTRRSLWKNLMKPWKIKLPVSQQWTLQEIAAKKTLYTISRHTHTHMYTHVHPWWPPSHAHTSRSKSYLSWDTMSRPSSSCISLFSSRLLSTGNTFLSAFSMPSKTSTRPARAARTAHLTGNEMRRGRGTNILQQGLPRTSTLQIVSRNMLYKYCTYIQTNIHTLQSWQLCRPFLLEEQEVSELQTISISPVKRSRV